MKFLALILLLCTVGLIVAESEKDGYLKARLSKSLKHAKGEHKKFKELFKPNEKFKKAVKDAKAKQEKTESTSLRRNLESSESSSEEMIPVPEDWKKYVGKLPVQRYRPNTDCSGTVAEWTFYDIYGSDECQYEWDMKDQQYYSWYWFCSEDDEVTLGQVAFNGKYCEGMPFTAILHEETDTCEVLREDYPPYYPDFEDGFFMIGSECSNKDKYDILKKKDALVISYYNDNQCEDKPVITEAFRLNHCRIETGKKGFRYLTYDCDPDSDKLKICEYTDPDCLNRKKCWKTEIEGNLPNEEISEWNKCTWDAEEEEWVKATCKKR